MDFFSEQSVGGNYKKSILPAQNSLFGEVSVVGDKSISHRAIIIAAASFGLTVIRGLSNSEGVLRTIQAMQAVGVRIEYNNDGEAWYVYGEGIEAFRPPDDVLYLGGSGTSVRLLVGLFSGCPFNVFMTGDASLRRRPLARVCQLLTPVGVEFYLQGHGLPVLVRGTYPLHSYECDLPFPSAQAKSALLLAGISTDGVFTVIEHWSLRDHTELMLEKFGANISFFPAKKEFERSICISGGYLSSPGSLRIPGDPSAAAFFAALATLISGSSIVLKNVCANPKRLRFFDILAQMGAYVQKISTEGVVDFCEDVVDIVVRSAPHALQAVHIDARWVIDMIDEIPIIAVLAAFAEGVSRISGLAELRLKESDRLEGIVLGLRSAGVHVDVEGQDLVIHGTGGKVTGGAHLFCFSDHRMVMAFAVLGLASQRGVTLDCVDSVLASDPDFWRTLGALGVTGV